MKTVTFDPDLGDRVRALYMRHPFPPEARRGFYVSQGQYILDRVFGGDKRKAKGKRLLDAGGGTGVFFTDVAEVIGPGPEYIVFDFSNNSLDVGRNHVRKHQNEAGQEHLQRMQFHEMNLVNLDRVYADEQEKGKTDPASRASRVVLTPEDKGFDFIQAWGVIHHTTDPYKVFSTLAKTLLNAGGYMRIGVYGETGNAGRRGQIEKIKAATDSMPLEGKIVWIRGYMSKPEGYDPTLCRPHLDPKLKKIEDAEIVDEFLHVHEHHLSLKEIVEWTRECGLEIVEMTDFENRLISFDIATYTNNSSLINAFDYKGKNKEGYNRTTGQGQLTPAQATLLDSVVKPYWIAMLLRKPENKD
ncbi:methyltransferase domain-containing protein [Candidatus Woesearchaeota archaeon]|nr:methyltransferase domain-containing protein [Candidatus Woesearchaeota archaeon]